MNTAIYLRDPHPRDTRTPTASGQEAACRSYCQAHGMTPAAIYADPPGGRDQLERLIAAATSPGQPYQGVLSWKGRIIAPSLEEAVQLRDLLRRHDVRLLSATETAVPDSRPQH